MLAFLHFLCQLRAKVEGGSGLGQSLPGANGDFFSLLLSARCVELQKMRRGCSTLLLLLMSLVLFCWCCVTVTVVSAREAAATIAWFEVGGSPPQLLVDYAVQALQTANAIVAKRLVLPFV